MFALVKSTNYRRVGGTQYLQSPKVFLFKPIEELNETQISNINICTEQEQTSAA